jgi:hypothetical protein
MWEYMSIDSMEMESLIEKANKLGKQGWQAFGFTSTKQGFGWGRHIMVLKRRTDKPESQQGY